VIESDPGLRLLADAESGAHVLELIERLSPALAILSTTLRDPSGLEAVRVVRARCPGTFVVLLAPADDSRSLVDGLRAGATGFVRSDVGRLDLLATLHRALAGEAVVDPAAARELIMRIAAEGDGAAGYMPSPLTPRELEILQLVSQGRTNREIAGRLIVAVGTIKVHVEHILDKLGASGRTQAAVRAVELGIVTTDDPDRRTGVHP
jgi:DNA-binding NarL/FixJ family response regulator